MNYKYELYTLPQKYDGDTVIVSFNLYNNNSIISNRFLLRTKVHTKEYKRYKYDIYLFDNKVNM